MNVKILVIAVVLCAGLTGCNFDEPITAAQAPPHLPTGATEITDKGNGWVTFRLDGRLFLYHRKTEGAGSSTVGFESVTQLTESNDR